MMPAEIVFESEVTELKFTDHRTSNRRVGCWLWWYFSWVMASKLAITIFHVVLILLCKTLLCCAFLQSYLKIKTLG